MTEDEMVGWHHWLSGHEFEQAPGDGGGQGRLVCCSPWGHKESDTTEQQRSHGSVFLVRSTHPGSIHAPTKTHFIRTKAAVEISRDLGCLCKLLRSLPFLSNYKEFRSSVSKKKKKRWWDQAHISQYVTVHALVSDPGQLRQFKSHWHITRILPSLYCLVHHHKKTSSRMMSLGFITLHFILSVSKC